jgi:negative regulator of sigma E activity
MTIHEFDERLSAYLDGKLPAAEKAQVEDELRQNPELRASLEQLKKLDQIARQAQVEMPAEGYFDGLAGRIDAKLARETRPRRGLAILQPIMPKGRLIAILSSVAALFLIVVVVNQIWKPEAERYSVPKTIIVNPPQQPESSRKPGGMDAQPAIATEPVKASDQKRRQEIPDSVLGKLVESDRTPVGVKDEEYKEPPVFPEPKKTDQTLAIPEASGTRSAASPADTLRQQLQPREKNAMTIIRSIDSPATRVVGKAMVNKPTSEKPTTSPQSASAQPQAEMDVSIARREEMPVTGVSIPLAIDSVEIALPEIKLNKGKFAETFDAAAYERRVQALLDSGKYVPVHFVAWDRGSRKSASRYDVENAGYQNWYDSLSVMGTEQWQAENAYREATRSRGNRLAEYITARLYIQHYLSSGNPSDTGLWRERLDEVRQWERGLRK